MSSAFAVSHGAGAHGHAALSWEGVDRAVADAIAARSAALARPILVGLAGAQGSGKTTMAARLASLLAARGLRAATLALDDFYLGREERDDLARTVHPLLATRGVPGTHDLALLQACIDDLLAGRQAHVPRFDKGDDDRTGTSVVDGRVEVVVFEGWCVGARAEPAERLQEPVNSLERIEDPDGIWRRWVDRQLGASYAALFARLDLRVFLRAPCFAVVERWRAEQEAHLGAKGMPRAQISGFVHHFERITRAMMAAEPADLVVDLDTARVPVGTPRPPAR